MANLSWTDSNIEAAVVGVVRQTVTSGEAITEGCPIYKRASDGKYYLALNSSEDRANVVGISLSECSGANQPVILARTGQIDYGAAVITAGEIYVLGDSAGAIMPSSDGASGDFTTVIGIGLTTTVLQVSLLVSGVART